MAETQTRMNPLIAAAAVAVIIFSAVGVGVMTGVIPSSKSASDSLTAPEPKVAAAPEAKAPAAPPAAHKPAPQTTQKHSSNVNSSQRPAQVAMNDTPARTAPPVCHDCGVVDAVNVVTRKGESTPLGAAGGAVVGGLVGHQIGNGRGNTAATIVGAVGGAVAGNEVEKRLKSVKEYQVKVRMEDGDTRTFAFQSDPAYTIGDKVKVVDGRLVRG